MNCITTRKELDNTIFEKYTSLSPEARQHLETCADCREYSKEIRKGARVVEALRWNDPVQPDAEQLTNSIMQAIGMPGSARPGIPGENAGRNGTLLFIQRLLTAASVCLILLFGYEQYRIVDKITRLEKQNGTIARDPGYRSALKIAWMMDRLNQEHSARSSHSENKAERTLPDGSGYLFTAGFSFQELRNILSNPDRQKTPRTDGNKPANKKTNR